MINSVRYPVFAFQKNDDMVYVFFKDKDLKSTTEDFLSKGGFKNDVIIDSSGKQYQIEQATFIKYKGLFGYNPLLKGRQILVDFEFKGEPSSVDLDEFKKDLIRRVESKKHYWLASWSDISELKKRIEKSDSFEAIANIMK